MIDRVCFDRDRNGTNALEQSVVPTRWNGTLEPDTVRWNGTLEPDTVRWNGTLEPDTVRCNGTLEPNTVPTV